MTTTLPNIQENLKNICDTPFSAYGRELESIGLIFSLDVDFEFEGTVFAEDLVEEYGITEEEATAELTKFVKANYLWKTEDIIRHMGDVISIMSHWGYDDEEAGSIMLTFAEFIDSPEVIEAFAFHAEGRPTEEGLLKGLTEMWIPEVTNEKLNEALAPVAAKRVRQCIDDLIEGEDEWVDLMKEYATLDIAGYEVDLYDQEAIYDEAVETGIDLDFFHEAALSYARDILVAG